MWRRPGEELNDDCIEEIEAYQGGSVMAWAGIMTEGRTDLVIIPGRLTAQRYVDEVLRPHVVPMQAAVGDDFILMQDNATPHTARVTAAFLENEGIETLDWPSRSPDLNAIENLWDQLKTESEKHVHDNTTLADLPQILTRAWNRIDQEQIRNLINSMRRRCLAVIENHGGHTRY